MASEPKTFDPTAHLTKIKTRKGEMPYLQVKHRLMWLRAEHPDANVLTECLSESATHARFRATISYRMPVVVGRDGGTDYLDIHVPADQVVAVQATGHGSETQEDFPDFYEKAETKAVGRALAILGYGTDAAPELDDGEPLDGLGAAKAERAARHQEVRTQADSTHAQIMRDEGTPAQPRTPPPPRISAVRQRPAEPKPNDFSGLFYSFPDGIRLAPPNVHTQHGITNGAALNEYLKSAGFDGGNKGAIIKELECTYKIVIESGRGTNQYGDPDVFPGELYDLARHLIEGREQTAAQ